MSFYETDAECAYFEYSFKADGDIKVFNNQYVPKDGKFSPIEGTAVIDKWVPGNLGVTFFFIMPRGDYDVIATDYENYAIVSSCSHPLAGAAPDQQPLWILTREPLEKESAKWNKIYAETSQIISEKLPWFDVSNQRFTV